MKRVGNLYHKIADPDNLRIAFTKAAKGKRDRQEVRHFSQDLDANLAQLRQQLLTHNVCVGQYHFFHVYDPKKRLICAASFRERVLHHAIMNCCEAVFERFAIDNSCACRKGKGGKKALAQAQRYCAKYKWYLKLDIRHYFDSIDHEVMLAKLQRLFKDKALLALFKQLLASYNTKTGKGLPIGNLVSQHFANYLLGYLDHWLKEQLKVVGYVRYMDDFVLFANDKAFLKQSLQQLERYLGEELLLTLHPCQQLNRCEHGLPFIGFRVYPHKIHLASRSRKRFADKLHRYEKMTQNGQLSECGLAERLTSLVAFTGQADATGFRRKLIFG